MIHGKLVQLNSTVSISIKYTIKGILISDVRIGERIVIDCSERDGEPFTGIMETSVIQDIRNGKIYTDNSVYELTEL